MTEEWRCRVCSYVHRGTQVPSSCPVCNSPSDRFIPTDDTPNTGDLIAATPTADVVAEPLTTIRRWRCSVCGYIHTGPEPPEKCPICGADRDKFVLLSENEEKPSSPPASPTAPQPEALRWRCTVCGYIHAGPEPPEKCPVCGADRSQFVQIEPEGEEQTPLSSSRPTVVHQTPGRRVFRIVTEHMVALHAHPISVHIPNGVAPVAVLFTLLSWVFNSTALETAAFANMVVVLLAMPFVLFSGYNDWQRRFGGHMTRVFMGKMICGGIFSGLSLVIVLWRASAPQIMASAGSGRTLYILLHILLLFVGAVAGYLGGKLVFSNHQ